MDDWDEMENEFAPPAPEAGSPTILDAPDILTFLKPGQTRKSKDYEVKARSVLKTAAVTCLRNDNVTDGAAILHHGPALARATGDLADASERAARVVDLLTTPENPWFAFTAIAVTMGLQLLRNHEEQARKAQLTWREARRERKRQKKEGTIAPEREPRGIPLRLRLPFGRHLAVRLPLPRLSLSLVFHAQTHDPVQLAMKVLSDEKIIKALAREGIKVEHNV